MAVAKLSGSLVLAQAVLTQAVTVPTAFVSESEWIMDPHPQRFNELARKAGRLNLADMHAKHVRNFRPQGKDGLLVMEFPGREEDLNVDVAVGASKDWELSESMKLCELYRREGNVGHILEIGAKVGEFTLPLADCVKDTGLVLAVEAMPTLADHLRAGIVADNATNVELYPYAVTRPIVDNIKVLNDKGSLATDFKVPLTTADAILHTNPAMKAIMLAKIELEGGEGLFLTGAQELFMQHPPCILTVELLPEELEKNGTPLKQVLSQFKKWGYRQHGHLAIPTVKEVKEARLKTWTIAYGKPDDHHHCLRRVKRELM